VNKEMKEQPRLKIKYETEVRPALMQELGISNPMAAPGLEKVMINVGIAREANTNPAVVEEMVADIAALSGQRPIVTKSKKAISNFKLRIGMDSGIMVTLRKDRMWDFLDKLINIVLPRVRDFRGVSRDAFDGRGNYALGLREHVVFPEVDPEKSMKTRSLQVIICTTAKDNKAGLLLLEKLGMPFKRDNK
jgi:large subunit ribosomal protein L5